MPSRIPIVFGAAVFGEPNTNTTRIHSLSEAQDVVDVIVSYGHKTFDTSRFYGNGSSEEFLGKLDLKGSAVDTKIYPAEPGNFSPEKLRADLHRSLKALYPHRIRTLYLHYPDRYDKPTSFEDTLREINEFHKEGYIWQFGLCNFFSWEVAEFVGIARANGWIQPTIYQGKYNVVERSIEAELIPCLRKYGIRFYAYNPLAGGLLVAKNLTEDGLNCTTGNRWDPNASTLAPFLHQMYQPLFPIFKDLKEILEKHNIDLAEAAHRWLQHHSVLEPEDAVLLGASNVMQAEANLKSCEKGPLTDDIVSLLDQAWINAKSRMPYYATM